MIYAICVAIGVILAEAPQVIREARQDKHYQEWLEKRTAVSHSISVSQSRRLKTDPVIEAEKAYNFFSQRPETQKKTDRGQANQS
ncbi:hypothetical protein JC2156_05600 [Weissella koreensis KCTC 3621]|uniref:hypothetical protein n=1 Tax=Weissella koreensis TaxID=165096 RepID=UPI00026F3EEA|nr:hypothetical protein [Weissella koreensis]EJF33746.1 hypothetical protein JC2156_05600 [Weissella koreensis KCTC 3621]